MTIAWNKPYLSLLDSVLAITSIHSCWSKHSCGRQYRIGTATSCVCICNVLCNKKSTIIPSLVIFHLLPIFTSSVLVFEALICITIAREWCALTWGTMKKHSLMIQWVGTLSWLTEWLIDGQYQLTDKLMDELADSVYTRREGRTTASLPRGAGTGYFRVM